MPVNYPARVGARALAVLLLCSSPALAQEKPLQPSEILDEDGEETVVDAPIRGADGQIIEEILITSQTRDTHDEQSISETSFSADDLKAMRIQDISDIARFTPGLEINTAFAASNPTLFIRGIGLKDYNANAAGAVPIFFDGMAINSPVGQLFQLFDVKNVTVLKGPQSGRWGRNSTAGAIIVDSNLPDGEFSSTGSLTYGSYNDVEVEGAIGFPILDEVLSGRVAFSYVRRDGYTRNGCAGWDPEANGFLEKSRSKTEELYAALEPQGPEKVPLYHQTPTGLTEAGEYYAWGNSDLAAELRAGNENRSIGPAVSEPLLYDEDGNPVYTQIGTVFELGPGRDTACVLDSPGRITNYAGHEAGGVEGEFFVEPNSVTLEDFQGLKPFTNNAHNWAARAAFLYSPSEEVEILLSFHGGQNLSDSAHLQIVPAQEGKLPRGLDCTSPENPCPTPEALGAEFREGPNDVPHYGWTEASAGEGLVEIDGILQVRDLDVPGSQNFRGRRGADPYLGFYDRDGQELLNIWGAGIITRWEEERFTFQSLTGYEANNRLVEDEGDASPRKLLYTDWSDESWQVSQEFRVEATRDDFSWQAGIYGLYEEVDAVNRFPAALRQEWVQSFDQTLNSVAAYASGHYDLINDRNSLPGLELLRLSAAFRASREQKFFQVRSTVTALVGGVTAPVLQAPPNEAIWSGVTGDVMLSWTPIIKDEYDITFHAKYNKGMKNGHFNAGLSTNPFAGNNEERLISLLEPVEPEHIDAIEIGFDSSWLEKRVLFSAAFYRYWYQDLQIFDLVNEAGSIPTQQLLSSDANILGIEGDLQIFPVEGLILGVGFNWLDSTFEDFVVSKRQSTGTAGARRLLWFDYSGNPTIAAPEFTLNGMAEYLYFIPGVGTLNPRIDYSYQTQVYLDPQGLDLISMPAYWYLDLRLAFLTPDEDLEVAFWMSNVTDKQYLVDVFDVSREFREVLQVWGEPRMMGVTVSFFY